MASDRRILKGRSFSLISLLAIITTGVAACAAIASYRELNRIKSLRTVNVGTPEGICKLEYLSKGALLLRVGHRTEASVSINVETAGVSDRTHVVKLAPGARVVSFFHNANGDFGFCVDGAVYIIEHISGTASMSAFNSSCASKVLLWYQQID